MAIEYAMLFTTKKKTKQECIHIHVIRETKKKKPVRRIRSTGLDTEKETEVIV